MKILVIQNRMGIGDMVIFLPFIKAISKKFNSSVSILVKENSKADQILKDTNYIDQIIFLKRNKKHKDEHDGISGFFRLSEVIKKNNFDKVFIFNSSLRFRLICKLAKINEIYQYPLFEKKNQHITEAPRKLLLKNFNIDILENPKIEIDKKKVETIYKKFNFLNDTKYFLLGIGGSGPTKRVPANKYLELMKYCKESYKCKFFIATGKNTEEQKILKEILNVYKKDCVALDNLSIYETMPIIKNCSLAVCNDTSFSHISSALNIPTIVLMCDTPLIYGSYSTNMYPILPDGVASVTHGTQGKENINPREIFKKLSSILG